MAVETALKANGARGDEEAFRWATVALGEARKRRKSRSRAALEALVEDLAFGLGAHSFPPRGARHAPARRG